MKPKTAIVLGLILVACLGYIIFRPTDTVKRAAPGKGQDQDVLGRRIFDPAESEPVKLSISDNKGTVIEFAADADKWKIVKPVKAQAEKWAVRDTINTFVHLEGQQAPDVTDEITGLDRPRWTVTIIDDKNVRRVLSVGKQAPKIGSAATKTYVAAAGKVFLVELDLAEKLSRPISEYRDKAVMSLDADRIVAMTISGKESYQLTKRGNVWDFASPASAKAVQSEVKKLIGKVANLTADEIVDPAGRDLSTFGLEKDSETAVIRLKLKVPPSATAPATTQPAPEKFEHVTLAFGGKTKDKVYVRRIDDDGLFLIDESLAAKLQPKLIDLREKQILAANQREITGISMDLPGGTMSLVKSSDGRWNATEPFAGKANAAAVGSLINKINSLKAESFRDDATAPGAYGLDSPRAKFALTTGDNAEISSLLIGSKTPSGEMTFIKTDTGESIAVVKTSAVKALFKTPAEYWNSAIMHLPAGAKVTRLTIRRPDGTFALRRKSASRWSMIKPIECDVDAKNVSTIINRIRNLSASRIVFLGKRVPDKYSSHKKIIVTAVTTVEKAKKGQKQTELTHILNVYRNKAGKVFAARPGRKVIAIGRCPNSLYRDLSAELRNRNVWKFDPKKIDSIKILAGKETVEIRRDGGSWMYPADPYVKIDTDKVKSFIEEIAAGKAEKFVNYKTTNLSKYRLDKPWFTVEFAGDDGEKTLTITVSHIGDDKTANRYAATSATDGVFIISSDLAGKMAKKLDDFKF